MTYADTRAVARVAGRDRIVVGGVDVTHFRDKTTPFPAYTLCEPFAYGATSLEFPQIHGGYEQLGVGELSWLREGARVVLSRVWDDGTEVIDYVGEVASINPVGRSVRVDVGGQFTGPAGMLEEQTQLYRQMLDVGRYASLAAARCGLKFSPWFGPETGVRIVHTGGQSLLSWAQSFGPMSQDEDGRQRALMPTTWGSNTWAFEEKDYDTVHYVGFNDDARVVVDVSRDVSEAPNVIYGTGITPDGERITGAQWPHVFGGPAPDYPMAGGADFGVGTTDADTVNGDGIMVLYYALRELGYLPFEVQFTGTYTAAFAKAVRKLQRAVGLTVTGVVDKKTWRRLYNVEFTGRKINGARIAPLAFDSRVEPYLYGTNGVIYGRNPDHDSTIPRVERHIDFGAGITESAMIRCAQGMIARSLAFKNWTGIITLRGAAVFDGSVAGVDRSAITEADLVPNRSVRPGRNLWIPDFDGGTLFHISGVDVSGVDVTLTVDTQARDLVEVRQIMDRDRESRRDLRREFFAGSRPNKLSSGMIACDKNFGWIPSKVPLKGGQWNVIEVVAGQQGQVNRVHVQLKNDAAEFAMAVASTKLTEKRCNRWFGTTPLANSDESWLENDEVVDLIEARTILYAAGSGNQPLGYGHRRKFNDAGDRTSAVRTGGWIDDDPWPYISAGAGGWSVDLSKAAILDDGVARLPSGYAVKGNNRGVLLYVAIYPDRDCYLKKGRILYPQLDDAA